MKQEHYNWFKEQFDEVDRMYLKKPNRTSRSARITHLRKKPKQYYHCIVKKEDGNGKDMRTEMRGVQSRVRLPPPSGEMEHRKEGRVQGTEAIRPSLEQLAEA
jgi:hypothetical protein